MTDRSASVSVPDLPALTLRLRPHHLLCLQNFRGRGYSPAFIRKMNYVRSFSEADVSVSLVCGCDDLCTSCPHRADGHCDSDHPDLFDALVLNLLENGLYGDSPDRSAGTSHEIFSSAGTSPEISSPHGTSPCRPGPAPLTDGKKPVTGLSLAHCIHALPPMSQELLDACCPECSWLSLCKTIAMET